MKISTMKMDTHYVKRSEVEKKRQRGGEYVQRREKMMKMEKDMEK